MNRAVRRSVRARAGDCCEYCRLPQACAALASFPGELVIARQHGGDDGLDNLCWRCDRCNLSKGPNPAGIDPVSGRLVPLVHPRRQRWGRHFRWEGPVLVGLTRTGRATVAVLDINHPQRVELRRHLIAAGEFPDG